MKARTYDEIRDSIYSEIVAAFTGYRVYDLGRKEAFRGEDFMEIELPAITYSLSLALDYNRVVDEYTDIDIDSGIGRVTEMLPYTARITIGCHAEFQKEAEELSHVIHQHWGYAPCFDGIGCRLSGVSSSDAYETGGVYSYTFTWIGWVRIAGRTQEAPLVTGSVNYPLDVLPEGALPERPPETPTEESPGNEESAGNGDESVGGDEGGGGSPSGPVPAKVIVFEIGEESVSTG